MNSLFSKNKIYVIAEAGINHNGKLNLALRMVEEAKKAKADCIKFQAFTTCKLVSNDADAMIIR